jgi:hypothetical protein
MLERQRPSRALPCRTARTGGTGDLGHSQRTTRLARIARVGTFFVTRAKDNLRFSRFGSNPKVFGSGVSSDQVGHPTLPKAREAFPWPLRRIRFVDPETGKKLVFLTNDLEVPAEAVAALYKNRWQIELFFRWIKQHLRIKHFFGTSPNAVKTQVWIAASIYVLIAILHKELKLPGCLHRTLQILSVHPFEKIPLHEILTDTPETLWTPITLTNCGCGS